MVSLGIAPAGAFGAHADLSARIGWFSVGLEARADLPASTGVAEGGRVSTHVDLGSIVPCFYAPRIAVVCGLLSLGAFSESGTDLATSRSAAALFVAAGARAGVEIPLGNVLFFLAHVDALAPLTRHPVLVDGADVFTVAPVTGSMALGLGVHF
jgi:hypothetical protein